jgi:hypothetical protein
LCPLLEFSKGGVRQRENLSALRIIFQPCTPLQPFFLQGARPGTLFTPLDKVKLKFIKNLYLIDAYTGWVMSS